MEKYKEKGMELICIIEEFFKEYGIKNIGSVETDIIKLKILIDFMEEENIDIKKRSDMYEFNKKFFHYFFLFQVTDYQKLLPFINSNKEESRQLNIIFECVDLIYSRKENEFKISYDENKYDDIGFSLLLENKRLIKLISKKISLKTLFLSDEKLKMEIIDEVMLMIKDAISKTDILEKMDDNFISHIFSYLDTNKESIRRLGMWDIKTKK
jgi:hypothetical protein